MVAALLLIGVWGAVSVPVAVAQVRRLESQPAFCYQCHEERPAHQAWLASGAARSHPNCIMCHSGPGFNGALAAQIKGARHVVKHFTGDYVNPIQHADMPVEFCTQCHALSDIAGRHDEVSDFGVRPCAGCHNHKPGVSFGESEHEGGQGGEGEHEGGEGEHEGGEGEEDD
jgi:nitrate/TMAO reductase-like tetraheme cytochrome c subunit